MDRWILSLICGLGLLGNTRGLSASSDDHSDAEPVSYYRHVLPVFQAHCQGCHQPAKAGGGYVMTSHASLLIGGDSGLDAIVAGAPDDSYLVELITPDQGHAEMPAGQPPLPEASSTLIRQWIAQGASDDTPATTSRRVDLDRPPIYDSPPVVTCLDCSPCGRFLAVAGFHEVLIHELASGAVIARLIGLSERIESVSFSPDGSRLAVAGGRPGRSGELQVWDVAGVDGQPASRRPELLLSVPVGHDTIRGGRWSPDGSLIAVGCADNTLRAFDSVTGAQVLFQGAHEDWVLDTVFSADGAHLVSVGRDMTARLTEVATQRFVDNITSITPGALTGGIHAVARHPHRDEIVIGGADGRPKVYRMVRQTERRIGDDANLMRNLPPLRGRIFAVAVNRQGDRIAAGSSLDGTGQLAIDAYEFDAALPEDVKRIMSKVSTERSPEENGRLDAYHHEGVRRITLIDLPAAVYTVAFHPDGTTLFCGGPDGMVRAIDVASGAVSGAFPAAPVTPPDPDTAETASPDPARFPVDDVTEEVLAEGLEIVSLAVEPACLTLDHPLAYAQWVVTATLSSGEAIDATRMARVESGSPIVHVTPRGTVTARQEGDAVLRLAVAGKSAEVSVSVRGFQSPRPIDYLRDVAPVITKMGCNQGTCHGAAEGKNGFRLSLRGYDEVADVRAFTDDHASRRTTIASPDDSLLLLKATARVPHVGGQLTEAGQAYYEILRDWLARGAPLDRTAARVESIQLYPTNPVVQQLGTRQQMRVIATYTDGTSRDVTREAFITSGHTDTATADAFGLITALRRGEAPVLARYQGAYAATTLTVMGDRTGFVWEDPPTDHPIDRVVAAKWRRLKIQPSPQCGDAEFLRRVWLDLTGLPPSADDIRAFLADPRDTRVKREEAIDQLVGSEAFIDFWTNKWADLLRVNRKYLGEEGAAAYRAWIRDQVAANRPYDEMVRSILTASGSNRENPAASYYKILRTPQETVETTTQLFLGIRFNCNQCHDHPFERWTQDQYFQTAAYFAQVDLTPDPESQGRTVGGSAVDGAKPYYEIVRDSSAGEMLHGRTREPASPAFPFPALHAPPDTPTRRGQFAAWLTSPDNPYFARSHVNRLWGYLLGVGLIEPIDDLRAGNPSTNPELLDLLTRELVDSGFDTRHIIGLICKSRTYQLSVAVNRWNEDDRTNYAHALARRLPAEVLFDAMHRVTGTTPRIPGVPEGTRAVQLPDAGVELPSGFLSTLGRPARETACECERTNDIQLGPVMALISGPVVAQVIADPDNAITQLVQTQGDDRAMIDELFFRVLNRPASEPEIELARELLVDIERDHDRLLAELRDSESRWAERKPLVEAERAEALAEARQRVAQYLERVAPQRTAEQNERARRIEDAEAAVGRFEDQLETHFDQFAASQSAADHWIPLIPSKLSADNGARLSVHEDRSVRASGNAGKGVYEFTCATPLRGLTALRLEAVPAEDLAGGGPGLAANGNFVVTELEVLAAPASDPDRFEPVALHQPLASFTQSGFDIRQAIDGATRDQAGWAVAPAGGTAHWATFQTGQPIGFDDGTVLRIRVHQYHDAMDHRLAGFRLSVTTLAEPVGLSLPESLATIAATEPGARRPRQQQFLADFVRKTNPEYLRLQAALADARRPLPADPELERLGAEIARLEQPIADDPALVQLRADAHASARQAADRRLTAAQDLVWALINSPAFLFNH